MHSKHTSRRAQRQSHGRTSGLPNCDICGFPVPPQFAFDRDDDGRVWVHPDCIMWTRGAELTHGEYPDRPLVHGQRLRHTCGNAMCVNPAHLEVA